MEKSFQTILNKTVDGKKVFDTIYNHIAAAIFNLEIHVRQVSEEHKVHLNATLDELRRCLDCDFEWTFVVKDPKGQSEVNSPEVITIH